MIRARVIPVLLLRHESLVKTQRFGRFSYIGDPCNTVRIFNELEVDELVLLDIAASVNGEGPNYGLLKDVANECFMPLAYGGGIDSLEKAKRVFDIGYEKIVINTAALARPALISEIASQYGSQALVASIDVKKGFFGGWGVRSKGGRKVAHKDPVAWAKDVECLGAGEILLTSIDREGAWSGFDLDLVKAVSDAVSVPVIAHGGASSVEDIGAAVKAHASAVALGSMVVFQKKGMGVLVNFPEKTELEAVLS